MSTKMLINQAAWNGDVDHLLKELDNNPTALHAITLEGGQNGLTPLHIAAACGHAEIVKKLLKVDLGLCLKKGKDGKIPLHSAVVKGKVEVIIELFLASLDSVKWKTAQHETCLHLAVKNHQFEALQVLIQHLHQSNKEDYMNSKDIYGNIILHVAVSKKQFEAAWNEDVDHLLKELDNNPTVVHVITLEGGESLLHIAWFTVHVNFVEEVIDVRHDFSRELNQDGFTPLHIVAACGHAEIVKKLLTVDLGLSLIKGKDGKIPLHSAVVKVVIELLLVSLYSVEWKTAQHETCLHLAVKNHQFEALHVLIQHLKQSNKEDLLNSKDIYGNTILHVDVSEKQFEIIQWTFNLNYI
ncbi:hypothetical protein L2E82_29382 [Cichorium intybus]|uniref:Uncharacterized protein n=1 Tax=Cichorium intybus TaxID=13427 RepID=A0ACB9CXG6_CICIN|nr:hypothetical protein L2E82_29382 [Cichorium intybus]